MMDLSTVHLPMKVTAGGKTQECECKIYYMGIIDILQKFNVRKRIEARYRKIKGGEIGASCVHPDVYADRFVEFFDEYTLAASKISNFNRAVFDRFDDILDIFLLSKHNFEASRSTTRAKSQTRARAKCKPEPSQIQTQRKPDLLLF